MKAVFDTNLYISWIRERRHEELFVNVKVRRFLSSVVAMELWAGAKTKQAVRVIEKLQQTYLRAGRCLVPTFEMFVVAGQIVSDMPSHYKNKIQGAGFINDIFIALTARSVGAVLFTENKKDFEIIRNYIRNFNIEYR